MHIFAVMMLHQHRFCAYKEKIKLNLTLLITCEYFVLLHFWLIIYAGLCKKIFEKKKKLFTVVGGGSRGGDFREGWSGYSKHNYFFSCLNKSYKVFYTQEFEVKLKKPRGRDLGFTLTHGPSGEGFYIHEIYASPALTPPRKLQPGDRILMVSHKLNFVSWKKQQQKKTENFFFLKLNIVCYIMDF